MAWMYKRKQDGGIWWIGMRANGKQILESTGEHDEAKARKKLATLEAMEAAQRAGRLNREFFEALTGAHIETVNLHQSLDTWLKETKNPNTRISYARLASELKAAMPHNPLLSDITQEQVRAFLATVQAEKRESAANQYLACTKAFFARFNGALRKDPTEGIPMPAEGLLLLSLLALACKLAAARAKRRSYCGSRFTPPPSCFPLLER